MIGPLIGAGYFDPDINDYDAYGLKIAANNILLVESLPNNYEFLIVLAPYNNVTYEQQCFIAYVDEDHYVYSVGVGSDANDISFYAVGQIIGASQYQTDSNIDNNTFITFYNSYDNESCLTTSQVLIDYMSLSEPNFLVMVVHPTGQFALVIAENTVFKYNPFVSSRITTNTSFWPDTSFTPRAADITTNFTVVAGLVSNGPSSRIRAQVIVYLIDNNLSQIYSNWTYEPLNSSWQSQLTFSGTANWSVKYSMSVDINNFDPTRVLVGVPYLNTVFQFVISGNGTILTLSSQIDNGNSVGFGKGVAWLASDQAAILANRYTSTFSLWLSSQIWLYTQLSTIGLASAPTAIIPNNQQPLPSTISNQFLNIRPISNSLAVLDVIGATLLILSTQPGFYASTDTSHSPESVSIPTISTKQACVPGTMKNNSGIHPCSLCQSGSRSAAGSINCTQCDPSAFCPLGAVAEVAQSELETLTQAYAHPTSPDVTSFDDILLANVFQLRPYTRCIVISPIFWTLITLFLLAIVGSTLIILQIFLRNSSGSFYIKVVKTIFQSTDLIREGEIWIGGLATITLIILVAQAYAFSTNFVAQYPSEQVGNSDFACDPTIRNAVFETSLQSLAIPRSDDEQVIFDLVKNQQFTLNVNLLNTAITCSSIYPKQIIDSLLVPINFISCSQNNSIVKTAIMVSKDAITIQFIIDDFKPIGGIGIGMSGPGQDNGSSTLKELGFKQAFYNADRTLAQSATVSLQLTMALNKTEPLSGPDSNFTGIWYPTYTVDKNAMFVTREDYISSSNLTQTTLTILISQSSYYIKHNQKPIVKQSEMIFKNFMFTLFCMEILGLPLLLLKLMIMPLFKLIHSRCKQLISERRETYRLDRELTDIEGPHDHEV
ncbi:unnamed protein product [Rotaria socialis]|uniref:Transmembrane protein n=1 Tax=Rotaria socialis TaxID=392032 RepID=A0A820U9Y0_9BILA|nr:unnamed protein product [Rotaria socialis]